MSRLLQSRSFNSGAASPMFDYEIRRILEQGTRLLDETARPGSTPPPGLTAPEPPDEDVKRIAQSPRREGVGTVPFRPRRLASLNSNRPALVRPCTLVITPAGLG